MSKVTLDKDELVIDKTSRRITITAPYFNEKLERVDRIIYYYNGDRPRLVVEDNGKPVFGLTGPMALKKIKELL